MYPAHLFDLFPPFPRDKRVFVAMSFDPVFGRRWADVIEPGIRDAGFEPHRVDASRISDSIVTEIVKGIANAKLIFADISAVGQARNPNVLYEVGLAHAVRQPQEVVLFRSDSEKLLFDLSTIRVNHYHPDGDPSAGRRAVTEALADAAMEVDERESLAVQRAVRSLDESSLIVLAMAKHTGGLQWPDLTTTGQVLGTFWDLQSQTRLLQAGLLEVVYLGAPIAWPTNIPDTARKQMRYRLTPLGRATLQEAGRRLFSGPDATTTAAQRR